MKVDNIHIMGQKIHANLPRFERNQTGAQVREKGLWEVGGKEKEKEEEFLKRKGDGSIRELEQVIC